MDYPLVNPEKYKVWLKNVQKWLKEQGHFYHQELGEKYHNSIEYEYTSIEEWKKDLLKHKIKTL